MKSTQEQYLSRATDEIKPAEPVEPKATTESLGVFTKWAESLVYISIVLVLA